MQSHFEILTRIRNRVRQHNSFNIIGSDLYPFFVSYSQDEFRAINADFEQNFTIPASLNDLLTFFSHPLYLTT